MVRLSSDSFQRPADLKDRTNPAVLYATSLLLIRAVVGVVGIVLPLVFIAGEAFFLEGDVRIRGSLSAYYHTSMRDAFVAGLCVVGFFLATYMAGQRETKDFWFSLVAGVAVLGVAFFPTSRPGLTDEAARCGAEPAPLGCSAIQQAWGETAVAAIHFVLAAVFILSLARICFLFAHREGVYKRNSQMATTLGVLGWVILGAIAWISVGGILDVNLGGLTPLYVGEVVSVWAFGTAWLLKSRDLLASLT